MSKKYLKFFLKMAISIGFLSWIVFKVDWPRVWLYLLKIEWWQMVLYFMTVIAGQIISSYKWKILAEQKNFKFPLLSYFKFYFTGTFINNFMPSFIGGDTYRVYQIGNTEKKYAEAASSVMMDRITGFIGGAILALIFALLNIKSVLKSHILIVFYILLVLSFVFDIIVTKMRHWNYFKQKIAKILPQKIHKFFRELGSYNSSSHIFFKSVFWGGVFAFFGVALPNFILFQALHINIGILDYLSTIFIISIITAVPISINNIGIKEWAYVTFFGIYGISSTSAITVALLSRFLQMLLSFFALPIYFKTRKKSIKMEKIEEESVLLNE